MTNVKISRSNEDQVVAKHVLENGQYYLDISENGNGSIYLVALNISSKYTLVNIANGWSYADGEGMCGDDADFVLLSNIEITYTR